MVKSYDRYEQDAVFGVIASQCNILWLPPAETQSGKSLGRAATGALEEILIWDIKTGELMQKLTDGLTPGASNAKTSVAPAAVVVLAYHQQTNLLASGLSDGSIKVWDVTSGAVMLTFSGHKSAVSTLHFDSTGTRIVSGSADSSIIVWDLVAEEGLFKLKGHKAQITGVALLHEAGKTSSVLEEGEDYLVSVSKDGLIKLWDLKAKQCIETHLAHSGECWALGVNAAKDTLITTGTKDQVKVWTLDLSREDGARIVTKGEFTKQSSSRCVQVAFTTVKDSTGTGEVFSLQNADRTCEMFRVRSADELKKGITKRTKRLREKGLDDDEILHALQEAEITMLITPLSTVRTTAKIRSCVWVPSSTKRKLDLLISLTNNSIEYHSLALPEQLRKAGAGEIHSVKTNAVDLVGHRTDIRAMDMSDDDRLLATASNGELKIWNIRTRNVVRTFVLEGGYALCCRFLPGGTLVVVGFKNGDLELYDLASSTMIDRIEHAHENTAAAAASKDDNGSAIWSMDITPDGKKLVTGGNDKCVKFWDFQLVQETVAGTDAEVSTLKLAHTQTLQLSDEVLCVRVSGDSKYLAISLLNNNVQVVFFDTLKLYLTLYGHKLPVLSIDMSSDSKLIITSSADKNIKIWGLDFGDCHKSIFGHQDSIMNVRFLPDSHNFFSAAKDGMVKYWDGDKFQCIQKLPAHQSEVWALCVSRSGASVVSTSHDHSIRLWTATNDQVFLEEEREKEMDELYETELLDSLEAEGAPRGDDENGEAEGEGEGGETTKVTRQTMETLKAGEKLMEAIDIGIEDVEATEAYEAQLRDFHSKKVGATMPGKPTPNAILQAYGITGQQHVLSVLLKIRAAQLEDALLVLPFSYTVKLMRFVQIWTNHQNLNGNLVNLATICKVLFFVIRVNAKELISQRNEVLRNHLIQVKSQLRGELAKAAKQLGYNTQGLKFQKAQWKMNHETEFIDETEQRDYEEKRAVKRTFATV
ncbi:hypothetical protein JCM33374_g3212 [Metschnikowia sp. JCM 33374]|nr:hypothetical protein JCM33374_g3212 [Metschnikowia sp. JCM 33374]